MNQTPSHTDVGDETRQVYRVAEWLEETGVDPVGIKEDISRKGPGYVPANAGSRIHWIACDHLDAAMDETLAAGI